MAKRQNLLVLYLADSALDAKVVGWSQWDGTGREDHMAGDEDTPPYPTGLAALRDGWRLLQMSQLLPHAPGSEHDVAYLKYEYLFERLVDVDG
jgi:hypothetical protein